MSGFEGIGDFDSDDPWQRYIAHQAAKGNYPPPPPQPPRPDRYGRTWVLPDSELCRECGQPDNCGDCNHQPLSDEHAARLGATHAQDGE